MTTLTKKDCLDAIERFTARRGLPENIYSDSSRTFIGTRGEIEFPKLLMDSEFKEVVDAFTKGQQRDWLTIPPRTPHLGGLWEATIKFTTRHFYRTVGKTKMSFENFTTLITQIEASLNSRPLTAPVSKPNDTSVLTPAHFLIGRPLTTLPEPSRRQPDTKQKLQKHQQHSQTISEKVDRGLLNNRSTSTKMAQEQSTVYRQWHCCHHGRQHASNAMATGKDYKS